jgi:hypothetical protein
VEEFAVSSVTLHPNLKPAKSHPARLKVILRALRAGWCWGVNPRDRKPALLSPRGTAFVLRGRTFVRWRNFFDLEPA